MQYEAPFARGKGLQRAVEHLLNHFLGVTNLTERGREEMKVGVPEKACFAPGPLLAKVGSLIEKVHDEHGNSDENCKHILVHFNSSQA
ncbi:MAG: hypothetical protein LAO07_19440 [Acidobacteriia bacterium]|nr:hypothetical protein [Terriglobia bacterium]